MKKGFNINELFEVFNIGITADNELMGFERFPDSNSLKVYYRLFDIRYINYDPKLVERANEKLTFNFINKENIGLLSLKETRNNLLSKFGITKLMVDKSVLSTLDSSYIFPLYLYPETSRRQTLEQTSERTPNLNREIVNQIAEQLKLKFTPEKEEALEENASPVCYARSPELREGFEIEIPKSTFAPVDLLDYIYAVLHSPTYREKYKEFLKIDFPKVPYPKDRETFWELVKLGSEIRKIHLLESPKVAQYITAYPIDGDNTVTRPIDKKDWELFDKENQLGRIWINAAQYFDKVPLTAWEFYIGDYQPAQKWLKDRKGRELNVEDILHYQKIIVALTETDRLMKEIDQIAIT